MKRTQTTKRRKEEELSVWGSGNVFVDLGFSKEEANELTMKSFLSLAVEDVIKGSNSTQAAIAKKLGIDQPKVSKLRNGNMSEFSIGRLAQFLLDLGYDIHIGITSKPRTDSPGQVFRVDTKMRKTPSKKRRTMKALGAIILCVGLLSASESNAQDQMQLSSMAAGDLRSADKALNTTYQQVLKKYAVNSQFITKLKQAELAWIKFRDAYTDSVFPEAKTTPDYYGSAFDMCWSATIGQQTTQRTNDLKKLLGGTPAIIADTKNKLSGASAEVSKLYQSAVKVKHDDEPSFAAKFKKAQDAWSVFASADADAWSALATDASKDATKLSRLCELNQLRAKSLNEWVKGIPEGDVCTGSRKVQD